MFEDNEILTLILGIAAIFIFIPVSRKLPIRGMVPFRTAVMFLTVSYFFTNLEAVYLHDVCNLLEHTFFAAAGGACLLATYRMYRGVSDK